MKSTIPGVLFCPHPPIIVHEVGQGREKEAELTLEGFAAQNALIEGWTFDSVLVFTPHAPMFSDAACLVSFEAYKDGLLDFGVKDGLSWRPDAGLARHCVGALAKAVPTIIMDETTARRYRMPPNMDHGSAVPLTMLNKTHDKPAVVIAPGALPKRALYEAGKALAKAIAQSGKRVLVIASGDMAHCHGGGYPYKPEGAQFDAFIRDALGAGERAAILNIGETLTEEARTCAYPSFVMALGVLDGQEAHFNVQSYEAPFGVGYLCASAECTGEAAPRLEFREREPYVALARGALDAFVKTGSVPSWEALKPGFSADFIEEIEAKRAGAFVSLHKGGDLRGCIGTIAATQPTLAEEIIYCACEAAGSDPRFTPVAESELYLLDVKTDILGGAEKIESPDLLDPKRYGVIVQNGFRHGLLLPDLEGVDTVERQIEIAKQKAGIGSAENVELQRFEVIRHTSSSFFHNFGVR